VQPKKREKEEKKKEEEKEEDEAHEAVQEQEEEGKRRVGAILCSVCFSSLRLKSLLGIAYSLNNDHIGVQRFHSD